MVVSSTVHVSFYRSMADVELCWGCSTGLVRCTRVVYYFFYVSVICDNVTVRHVVPQIGVLI